VERGGGVSNENQGLKMPPDDVLTVYGMLTQMFRDLTDVMQTEVKEWMEDLKDQTGRWRVGEQDEPDWQAFRESMNEICREDAMPPLFGKDG
jgi:hypothetical protein